MSEADTYDISPEYLKELQEWQEIENTPVDQLKVMKESGELHKAEDIRAASEELIGKLGDFVIKWELCGAVRRGHPMSKDGDIVVWMDPTKTVPEFQGKLARVLDGQTQQGNVKLIEESLKLFDSGQPEPEKKKRKVRRSSKPKPPRKIFTFHYSGIKLEISIARDEQQFEVLKFIRTGSADFHKELLQKAQAQNMTVNFHHDETFNMDLYGLYGATQVWKEDRNTGRRKPVWAVNPARLVGWTEKDIIEAVYGVYIEPENREPGKY